MINRIYHHPNTASYCTTNFNTIKKKNMINIWRKKKDKKSTSLEDKIYSINRGHSTTLIDDVIIDLQPPSHTRKETVKEEEIKIAGLEDVLLLLNIEANYIPLLWCLAFLLTTFDEPQRHGPGEESWRKLNFNVDHMTITSVISQLCSY